MSARRPPRRGASPRARSLTGFRLATWGARGLRRAVVVASLLLGGGVAAGSTAEAWTVNPPRLAPIARVRRWRTSTREAAICARSVSPT